MGVLELVRINRRPKRQRLPVVLGSIDPKKKRLLLIKKPQVVSWSQNGGQDPFYTATASCALAISASLRS